ncbi:RimK family alpha-L-glutamate ligase [Virgibacillus halophilus]|uniref:RimK family alpha-L-glutamate ligase n=2 Tax=Tigheibacillus halophilus TaxID=361280 RepID=A0ABU5CDG8_9BACI|nr:RimK family alpha-L-glutamate ligase [Virgibacillus halophilus]
MDLQVFNKAETIAVSDDKIATYQRLARAGLPIPKTIVSPKVFLQHDLEKFSYTEAVIKELGFPMIVKEAFGSFGEQVHLIQEKSGLLDIIRRLHGKPFMFQEFIQTSYGTDVRLQVVGNRVVAAMKRIARDDFRANVTAGASMEPYHPTYTEEKLAVAAAKTIDADFAGIDLLFGKTSPVVCEINSNAHIRNLLNCTGTNAADFIADHVLQSIQSEGVSQ